MRHKSLLFIISLLTLLYINIIHQPAYAASSTLEEQFQSEFDTLHKEGKFPGALASYILPDGTVGVATTGLYPSSRLKLNIQNRPHFKMRKT